MKIAVYLFFSNLEGGATIHTLRLVRNLVCLGHQVKFYFASSLGGDLFEIANQQGLETTTTTNLEFISFLGDQISLSGWLKELKKQKQDLIIVPKGGLGCGSVCLELASRVLRIPLISILHNTPPVVPPVRTFIKIPIPGPWRIRYFFQFWFHGFLPSKTICVSEQAVKNLANSYGFPRSRMSSIHNGVDAKKFKRTDKQRSLIRAQLGIQDNEIVLGSVGRLTPVKNLNVAIYGMKRIIDRFPKQTTRLVFFGCGPDEQKLKNLTNQLSINDRVIFAGFTKEPWLAYSTIDIFLMPSISEGLPLSLAEAMASECYCIANDVGGTSEIIEHDKNGIVVDPQNPENFIDSMSFAIGLTPTERATVGKLARERVREKFCEQAQLNKFCRELESYAPLKKQS